MERKATALELYRYFSTLDLGDQKDASKEPCAMHYGCACVTRNGMAAAQMLMDVFKALGIDPATSTPNAEGASKEVSAEATPNPEAVANASALAAAERASMAGRLENERKRLEAAQDQIARMASDNQRLRDHIRLLQRQLDRMHERREMSAVLNRIDAESERKSEETASEGGDKSATSDASELRPMPGSSGPDVVEDEQGAVATIVEIAPPSPPNPESEAAKPVKTSGAPPTLAEALEMEGAMPVGKEDADPPDPNSVHED